MLIVMQFQPDYHSAIEKLDWENKNEDQALIRVGLLAKADENSDIENAAIGASRFGGSPDVPVGFDWPTWRNPELEAEQMLAFVAQLNMADLPDVPERSLLPEQGLLSFFYASDDNNTYYFEDETAAAGQVRFFDTDPSSLQRTEQPDPEVLNISLEVETLPMEEACLMAFRPVNTIPNSEHIVWHRFGKTMGDVYRDIHLANPELAAWFETHGSFPFQTLGCPRPAQSAAEGGVLPINNINDELIDRWLGLRLLFSARDFLGDCSIHYLIDEEDLRNRNFEKVVWAVECT